MQSSFLWLAEFVSCHCLSRVLVAPCRYRALRLDRPSAEMSGEYSCSVTSLHNQDSRSQEMIVYAPPRRFDLSLLRPAPSAEPQLRCHLEGVFPQPLVHMFTVQHTRVAGTEYVWVANLTKESYSVEPLDRARTPATEGYLSVLTTAVPNPRVAEELSSQHHQRTSVLREQDGIGFLQADSHEAFNQAEYLRSTFPAHRGFQEPHESNDVHGNLQDVQRFLELQGVPFQVVLQDSQPPSLSTAASVAQADGETPVVPTAVSHRQLFFCVFTIPSTDIKQSRVLEVYPESYTSDGRSRALNQDLTLLSLVPFLISALAGTHWT
ncbi:hypothetical protein BIW11_08376 [Tropilaelaps mercedesae]|uniref:Ig-like domain-containing protein n=1 Tax=Tropilaelaps mercedesae TaxID=418985 RepID=A0A1V9XPT2_9ACAR|nr:hypothetical protein BIW11_08376 [Tropilaelaps mercedesae]